MGLEIGQEIVDPEQVRTEIRYGAALLIRSRASPIFYVYGLAAGVIEGKNYVEQMECLRAGARARGYADEEITEVWQEENFCSRGCGKRVEGEMELCRVCRRKMILETCGFIR